MKNKILLLLQILCITGLAATFVNAQTVPAQQAAGGVEARRDLQDKDLKLKEGIQKGRPSASVEQPASEQAQQVPEGEKVLITKIQVTGATRISAAEIRSVVGGYENKELSLRQMQEVANKLTDLFRQRGFITSRAVLPPQKVENATLKIDVVEGRMGKVDVKGNKYFSTSLIKRKIALKSGDAFDYNKLKANLSVLNQGPDRNVKTVLTPGQEAGTTDLVLNVEDKLPIHVGLAYDNYGSRYLRKNRYQGTLTHNNLLGFDDSMTLTYQVGEGSNTYQLMSGRYLFPVSNETQVGVYVGKTNLKLGEEFVDLNARGKTAIYSVYVNQILSSSDTTEISMSAGFDYKNITNFQLYEKSNGDYLRVGRLGLKFDRSDANGRTIINNEIDQGFPHMFGGLGDKEPSTKVSRVGAGGLFTKNVLDVLRLQRMPAGSTLLLKGQMQLTSHVLTATEQFQLGGIANLRGFAPGEAVGDTGQTATAEWSFPVYFIPKGLKAPMSKATLYDSLRLAAFYDWGHVSYRTPLADEAKATTLNDAGVGLRYDLPENFSCRLDMAWPIEKMSSDGNHLHTWVKVSKDF